MNELITSAVFLTASLYGGGQMAGPIAAVPVDSTVQQATSTPSSSTATTTAQVTAADTSVMQAYLHAQFGDKDAILVDIARCESNYHQFDVNGNVIRNPKTGDIGVMQINEKYHADTAKKLGLDLYTVEGNVAYAKRLYEEQGTAPWNSSAKCWAGDIAKN